MHEAYRIAVQEINKVAGNPDAPTARRELEALRALIELLASKLPIDVPDYNTEGESNAKVS